MYKIPVSLRSAFTTALRFASGSEHLSPLLGIFPAGGFFKFLGKRGGTERQYLSFRQKQKQSEDADKNPVSAEISVWHLFMGKGSDIFADRAEINQ